MLLKNEKFNCWKNSFLSKNLNLRNSIKVSHQDIKDLDLNRFDKLILISFPPEYKEKKESDFLFEKKLFDEFVEKNSLFLYPKSLSLYFELQRG